MLNQLHFFTKLLKQIEKLCDVATFVIVNNSVTYFSSIIHPIGLVSNSMSQYKEGALIFSDESKLSTSIKYANSHHCLLILIGLTNLPFHWSTGGASAGGSV